jgi:hypothetical protein
MKQKVILTHDNEVLFEGNPLNLPFKEASIKEKSIELFDDEDPCMIHQSHIAREFVQTLMATFKEHEVNELNLSDFKDTLDFINVPNDTLIKLKR